MTAWGERERACAVLPGWKAQPMLRRATSRQAEAEIRRTSRPSA
jgi:hypothetical protein